MSGPEPIRARDVLLETVRAYRRNWRFLLAAGALLFVPVGLVSAVDDAAGAGGGDPGPLLALFGFTIGVSLAANVLFASLVAAAVVRARSGGDLSIRAVAAMLPWSRMLAVDLLFLIAVLGGLLLLIVPGLIALVRLGLAPALAELDEVGVSRAFARSRELTRRRAGLMLMTLLPVAIITTVANDVVQELIPIDGLLFDWASSSATSILLNPFYAIVTIVLVLELRRPVERAAAE